jgi:puromycin-sensitive aminopeptidase
MASTQFESLDARRAFPCWDEPARKAAFGVTLVVPVELTAFSNMPEIHSKTLEGGKLRETKYLDTPVMSSYLVAFCVGEFDYVQAQTSHGVLVKVYTPPGKSETGQFALDCATKSLDAYDNFFGIPYPLPKLDMVAIPEFAMGAMENWGLVTYREVDLLIDPSKASNRQKQRVCTVVTHELAHQVGPTTLFVTILCLYMHRDHLIPLPLLIICLFPHLSLIVVWKSCHHGMVGRPLAQRRFCFVGRELGS